LNVFRILDGIYLTGSLAFEHPMNQSILELKYSETNMFFDSSELYKEFEKFIRLPLWELG
jgi:hypothetical protein